MELATEIARAYSDETIEQESLFETEQGLISSVNEMCGYAGKIIAVRSLDGGNPIARATFNTWSRQFRHQSFVSEAVGIASNPCPLFLPLTLEAREGMGRRRVDVQYSLLDLVHPQTFEPLVSVEVFERR